MILISALALCASLATAQTAPPRHFHMALGAAPPKMTLEALLKNVEEWTPHADSAIDHRDIPWTAMLVGTTAGEQVAKEAQPLMGLFRKHHLMLVTMMDPADGLDRQKEAPALLAAHRSIADPEIQKLYVNYVEAYAKEIKPEYLGLGSEVNVLLDFLKPDARAGLIAMCNEAAKRVHAVSPDTKLYVSVQVDYAWGKITGSSYKGVEKTFKAFPFVQELGLSTYAGLTWASPKDVPDDYFTKLLSGRKLGLVMDEGGWPSAGPNPAAMNESNQAEWLKKLFDMMDKGNGVVVGQLTYTDLETSTYGAGTGNALTPFSRLGLVDMNYKPKPAFAVWNSTFARPLAPDR